MKKVEYKYKVSSFQPIQKKLKTMGYSASKTKKTTHYYARRNDLNVSKIVEYSDRVEIHELREKGGTFELSSVLPCSDIAEATSQMSKQDFNDLQKVDIQNSNYDIEAGRVGLYIINNSILSVILEVEKQDRKELESVLGLTDAPRIHVPYNVYASNS